MIIQNKHTGKRIIAEFLANYQTDDGCEIGFREAGTTNVYSYKSISEFTSDWEDMPEEPAGISKTRI